MTTALDFLADTITCYGDGPPRRYTCPDGSASIISWEVNGVGWMATSGALGVIVHAENIDRLIRTTHDGDPAFRVAVLAATLACSDGVRL